MTMPTTNALSSSQIYKISNINFKNKSALVVGTYISKSIYYKKYIL